MPGGRPRYYVGALALLALAGGWCTSTPVGMLLPFALAIAVVAAAVVVRWGRR